ncbi:MULTISPECIES: helix-turn-helix domain-containing protein [unclassified Sphingomonas]|uniref:helix-turn-helix domain-containing protein n=1 Tax=unclassified Sphingomonas TaxID=196159 RepID=UPI0012E3BFB9|nr:MULTISPECIES: helix-turn-helix domain-containing protein [unclassified Sphingomonas]
MTLDLLTGLPCAGSVATGYSVNCRAEKRARTSTRGFGMLFQLAMDQPASRSKSRTASTAADWAPGEARWTPAIVHPETPILVNVSTDAVPPADRFAYWCNIAYYHFEAMPRPVDAPLFSAEVHGALMRTVEIYRYRSDAVRGVRTTRQIERDGGDMISIGFVIEGERQATQQGDRITRAGPGNLFVYDAARPCELGWTAHRGMHVGLPRRTVVRALGHDVPRPSVLIDQLNRTSSITLLRRQFEMVLDLLPMVEPHAAALMLDQLVQTISFALMRIEAGPIEGDATRRRALYSVAMMVIDRHLSSPGLSPDLLANRLNCSRATLYRAFADQGTSIAAVIHQRRFERARRLLRTLPASVAVSEIATRCGIYDTINFSRRYRSRFGCTPSDERADPPCDNATSRLRHQD